MARQSNKLALGAAVAALALSLTACTSVKNELGVGRNSPDEFMVIKRAPLTMPPDYTLRPPASPDEASPAAEASISAKTALLGKNQHTAEKSSAENSFLDRLGAATANPDIRKQIDEENGHISLENRTVAEKLIFWDDERPSTENIPSSVVDPKAEAARLKKNKEEGKPANEGTVPVIEKKKGTIDKIF